MRGKNFGSNGLLERLWVIVLGLLAIMAIEFTPLAGLRATASRGTTAQPAATPVGTAVPPPRLPATAGPTPTAPPPGVAARDGRASPDGAADARRGAHPGSGPGATGRGRSAELSGDGWRR